MSIDSSDSADWKTMSLKVRHDELASHQQVLVQNLRTFWKEGLLCDVVLKSTDGTQHPVHRIVLSAASAALKALLCAPFREAEQIREGKPIEIAASAGVVEAFVDYLYGGEPDIASVDAVELIRLAGAYGLVQMAAVVEHDLCASMNSSLALQILHDDEMLGLSHKLRQSCEEQIAEDFQACTLLPNFLQLNAMQLQRILKREDLKVDREEDVVEGLLTWAKVSKDRQRDMAFLFSHIDLPSLCSTNLDVLCLAAQSMGPSGAHVECEVREAMATHGKRRTHPEEPVHRPKRWCLENWSAGWGAELRQPPCISTKVVSRFAYHQGTYFAVNGATSKRISALKPGESHRVLAGKGAPVNGFNSLNEDVRLSVAPNGDLFVASGSSTRWQLVRFCNGSGEIILDIPWEVTNVFCSRDGVLYVLGTTSVQKLEGSQLSPVINSEQLPEEYRFLASDMFALRKEGVYIYISDNMNKRVLRFFEGESIPTVVAEFREREPQLGSLFVTEDERIFVADRRNRKILTTDAERTCSELDLAELGEPVDLLVEDDVEPEILNVLIQGSDRGSMHQFFLPRRLKLDGFWMVLSLSVEVMCSDFAKTLPYSLIDRMRCSTFFFVCGERTKMSLSKVKTRLSLRAHLEWSVHFSSDRASCVEMWCWLSIGIATSYQAIHWDVGGVCKVGRLTSTNLIPFGMIPFS